MAMRLDPPDPPPAVDSVWWQRSSVVDRDTRRTLFAKIVVLREAQPWIEDDPRAREIRALIEYYGDRAGPPGLVQRYTSRAKAEQVLERRGWTRCLAET